VSENGVTLKTKLGVIKNAPFDRPYATFYWSAIVNLVPFPSYLTLSNIVTLQSGLEVTQGH